MTVKELKAHEDNLKRIRVLENCDRPHAGLPRVNDDLHIDAKMTATLGNTYNYFFDTSLIELIT